MKTVKRQARILASIPVVLVTMATIPATAQTDQTFEKAVTAYEQNDYVMAYILFGAAAEEGHPEAQFGLGLMYARGEGVSQNDGAAVRWFRQAAEQGHAEAQFHLGLLSVIGKGISQSTITAVRWFRRAAEQGHAGAQFRLGFMYADGKGVEKDEAKAFQWVRLAATQGNAQAQTFLGTMYASGTGVEQNEAQAVRWLRLAAKQGYAHAQDILDSMYKGKAMESVVGSGVQNDSPSEMELFVAGRIAETLDEPEYSFMNRCDSEQVFQMANKVFKPQVSGFILIEDLEITR